MMAALRNILEMIKFSHTVFALPFAVMAAFLAVRAPQGPGRPGWGQLALIVAAMVFARSTAMAFNRLADEPFDAANPRTAGRHLPRGLLSRASVILFTIACAVGFFAVCAMFQVFFDNPWPAYLSAPVLAFLCLYSYTKRFTALSHFWLGASLMAAPAAAYIALRGRPGDAGLAAEAFLLGAAVLFWTAGFDIIYACQDTDFDRSAGLKSVPAALGNRGALWLARLCHVAAIGFLVAVGRSAGLGLLYGCGVVGAGVLLAYEHSLVGDWRLLKPDLSRVNTAFFTVNGCVSLGLATLAVLDLFFPMRVG
jgi:4-hydroxybenzoate polyprenyltransferase